MTDELERRVRDALHRAPLPAAPETLRAQLERLPTVASPAVARRRRASAWLLATAAAVVLAVGAIWLPGQLPGTVATPSSGSSPRTNGSPTPFPAGLIPWIDATPTPVPSPTPVVIPPGTRTCVPNDLTASAGWQGATGQVVGGVVVTNTSSTPCAIAGPPRQLELLAGATILKTAYLAMAGTDPGATVTTPGQSAYLKPGDQAGAFVGWSNWCGATRPTVSAVLVTLPGGGHPITAGAMSPGPGLDGFPRCDAPSNGSTLSAWEFEAVPPQQPATEPLSASVSLSAPPTATAGQVLDFTVTLTNLGTQPASLEPCPTYTEDLIVGGRALKPPASQDYLLNCPAMGPQIAAGASVVLAMRYAIPADIDPGPVELGWSMDPGGPFDSLSASARVTLMIEGAVGPEASSPPCAPSEVAISVGGWAAAAGTTYAPIHLALVGATPCTMAMASLAILDRDGQVVVTSSEGLQALELTTSRDARLGWSSWCGPPPQQPLTVRFDLGSGVVLSTVLPTGFGASCMNVPTVLYLDQIAGP